MKRDSIAPPHVARSLAILHMAMHSAYLKNQDCNASIVHLTAYKACSSIFPGHEPVFEAALRKVYPVRVPDSDRDFADACVGPVLKRFEGDGSAAHVTYVPKQAPSAWRRTHPFFRAPELPHWPLVKPILLSSCDQFRPAGPPSIDSEGFHAAVSEIKEIGSRSSTIRTPEQSEAARFWSDFSYTETPVGHWNSIARQIAENRHLKPAECARLFSVLNVAMADTALACWDAKYTYHFWRPITAIQNVPLHGEASEAPPPSWIPFLNTPSHPEYVSGHSAFSGAGSTILKWILGADGGEFKVKSDTLPTVIKTFHSLDSCARECGESRIYGGIHFRFSCEDGFALGREVAEWTWTHFDQLKP